MRNDSPVTVKSQKITRKEQQQIKTHFAVIYLSTLWWHESKTFSSLNLIKCQKQFLEMDKQKMEDKTQ